MTRSMTGYARAVSSEVEGLKWQVEIHAVNRRGLDLNVYLSKELLFLDLEVRKLISHAVKRGQVTVKAYFKKDDEKASIAQLKKRKSSWQKIANELGFSNEAIDLTFLLTQTEPNFPENETKIEQELKRTLESALKNFTEMKEEEGKALADDIKSHLTALITLVKDIENLSKDTTNQIRQKLTEKLQALISNISEDERVAKEIALLGEKADITEEIVRLRSHIDQMQKQLDSTEKSIGRTLEFLNQEMVREVNTIASKAASLEIAQKALSAKGELEKIREQIQNIE